MEMLVNEMREENITDVDIVQETNGSSVANCCRLCLREHEVQCPDIFASIDEVEPTTLAERFYELFQVKYENLPPLPQRVCKRCMFLVQAFTEFRNKVQTCESELLKRYRQLEANIKCEDYPPGLNDNAGVFVPDDDCEIIEVDPDQEYESSDDDFSESESEPEETPQPPQTSNNLPENIMAPQVVPPSNAIGTTQLSTETTFKTPCYLCQYCDMAFSVAESCTLHETTQHDQQYPYACNFCEIRHTSRQSIVAHIRQNHQPDRPYVCTLCGKLFCRRSDLKKHTIVHTGIRPYTCPICSKGFSRNPNLLKHMRIHTSSKPHVCQLCPRSFGTEQELASHTRSHSEPKPNQCDQCPSSFMRKDQLALHKMSHLRQQPSEVYQQLQTMNSHETESVGMPIAEDMMMASDGNEQHTSILAGHLMGNQQRPRSRIFNCDICSKSFTREKDYFQHQALHLEDIYTCKLCNISFSRREKLMRHIEREHGAQFICESCNIKFPNAEGLQVHMKMHELHQQVAMSSHTALGHFNTPIPPSELMRPSAEEINFYSQMVPTMNLGFYSETRPDA